MAVDELHRTVAADLGSVGEFVLETAHFLERRGVGGRPLHDAQLLLEEVVTNVVRHAFRADSGGRVDVRVGLDGAGIALSVEDDARAFDPLASVPAPSLDVPLEARTPGGLGLHLVRSIADEIAYERRGGKNVLTMRLRVPRARRADPATAGDRRSTETGA